MTFIFTLCILLAISVFFFFNHPKFGRRPSGNRMERIKNFQIMETGSSKIFPIRQILLMGRIFYSVKRLFFGKSKRNIPSGVIPSQKTDLKNLDREKDVLVWFGHSSYFMQLSGKTFWLTRCLVTMLHPYHLL